MELINSKKTMMTVLVEKLSLRERYVLTRQNNLRLRYIAAAVSFIMVLSIWTGLKFTQNWDSSIWLGSAPDSAQELDAQAQMALSTRRLERYVAGSDIDMPEQEAAFVPASPKTKNLEIKPGDTLTTVMEKAGAGARDSYLAVSALQDSFDPRNIRPGQELSIRLDPVDEQGTAYRLGELSINVNAIETAIVRYDEANSNYVSDMIVKETAIKRYAGMAEIEVSLYGSAVKNGIPSAVIAEAIKLYSWDVDFQRDIRAGDKIEILYDQVETLDDGERVRSGDIHYARLTVGGKDIDLYRFERENGDVDYYTAEGESTRKALMRTPVDGARLSSGFGMRKHPVLGYNKMHKGLDFAAPTGTPIYAAGDGTIEKAARFGAYGNYIRIRHNSSMKTAYAHLSRYAKGITAGKRVKQGEVIGYVGSTGRSTGPHLHYEVIMNGEQVNPRTIKIAQGDPLKGNELTKFKAQVKEIDRDFKKLIKNVATN